MSGARYHSAMLDRPALCSGDCEHGIQQVNHRGRRAWPEARKPQRLCAGRGFEEGQAIAIWKDAPWGKRLHARATIRSNGDQTEVSLQITPWMELFDESEALLVSQSPRSGESALSRSEWIGPSSSC